MYSHRMIDTGAKGLRNKKTTVFLRILIGQNNKESPGDLGD